MQEQHSISKSRKLNGIKKKMFQNTDKQNIWSNMCNTPQKSKAAQIRQNRQNMRKKIISEMTLPLHLCQTKSQLETNCSETSNQQPNGVFTVKNLSTLEKFNLDKKNQFLQKYDIFEKIGQGGISTIYRCKQKKTNEIFAVKVNRFSDEQLIENYRNQFKKKKLLSNKSIINHKEFFMDKSTMTTYTLLQNCYFKNLKEVLYHRPQKKFSQEQTAKVLYTILKALDYIHQRGVVHRDIKPQNILYNPQDGQIRMIDFDCSKFKKETEQFFELWTKTGTLYYQAPEMFLKAVYNEKVDIWGAGIIAYELLTGKLPFYSAYSNKTVKMILSKEIDFQSLKVSNPMKKLLKGLLQKDSIQRFNTKEALEVCSGFINCKEQRGFLNS